MEMSAVGKMYVGSHSRKPPGEMGRIEYVNGKVTRRWHLGWGSGLDGSGQVKAVCNVGVMMHEGGLRGWTGTLGCHNEHKAVSEVTSIPCTENIREKEGKRRGA